MIPGGDVMLCYATLLHFDLIELVGVRSCQCIVRLVTDLKRCALDWDGCVEAICFVSAK